MERINLDAKLGRMISSKVSSSSSNAASSFVSKYRSSDGVTRAEWEFPETAPLIFPALENASGEKKKGMATKMAFVADYFDRRAVARFVSLHWEV